MNEYKPLPNMTPQVPEPEVKTTDKVIPKKVVAAEVIRLRQQINLAYVLGIAFSFITAIATVFSNGWSAIGVVPIACIGAYSLFMNKKEIERLQGMYGLMPKKQERPQNTMGF